MTTCMDFLLSVCILLLGLDCGEPLPVPDGVIRQGGTTFQAVRSIECNQGYILDGERTIECQANGEWFPVPVCTGEFYITHCNCIFLCLLTSVRCI